jgi:WD40 repeat protein
VNTGRGDGGDLTTAFFDTTTGELLAHLSGTPYGGLGGAFSSDGSKLVVGSFGGLLSVLDVETVLSGAPIEEAVDIEIAAHDTLILTVMLSPDGTTAATAAFDEPLKLWDLESGQSLGEFGPGGFGNPHLGDFHPTLPHLLVTTPPNQVRIHTLNIDELVAIAEAGLSRDMTEPECQQYFRGSCPP